MMALAGEALALASAGPSGHTTASVRTCAEAGPPPAATVHQGGAGCPGDDGWSKGHAKKHLLQTLSSETESDEPCDSEEAKSPVSDIASASSAATAVEPSPAPQRKADAPTALETDDSSLL